MADNLPPQIVRMTGVLYPSGTAGFAHPAECTAVCFRPVHRETGLFLARLSLLQYLKTASRCINTVMAITSFYKIFGQAILERQAGWKKEKVFLNLGTPVLP